MKQCKWFPLPGSSVLLVLLSVLVSAASEFLSVAIDCGLGGAYGIVIRFLVILSHRTPIRGVVVSELIHILMKSL